MMAIVEQLREPRLLRAMKSGVVHRDDRTRSLYVSVLKVPVSCRSPFSSASVTGTVRVRVVVL